MLCTVLVFGVTGCSSPNETETVIDNAYAEYVKNQYMECFKAFDINTIDVLCNEINSTENYKDKYDTINLICDSVYKYVEKEHKETYEISKYTLDKMSVICTADSKTKAKVQEYYKVLLEKIKHETYKYLTGTWQRDDTTNFSGGKIKVGFVKDDDNEYFVAEIVKVPDVNEYAFEVGEIKWKDIIIKNDKSFYFNDLVHAKEGMTYEMAEATINKEEDTISVKFTDKYSNVSGSTQVWKKVK